MSRNASWRASFLLAFGTAMACGVAPGQQSTVTSAGEQPQPAEVTTGRGLDRLTPEAEQIANVLGIADDVRSLRGMAATCAGPKTATLEELTLRQQVGDAVMRTSLDVDGVVAQIDYERAQILERQAMLSNARDRTINLLSLANIVAGTGSGIVTNAMQFSNSTALAGDGIGVGGGAAGVLLSLLGLRVQGGRIPLGIAPNMLAPIFGRPSEVHSVYPPTVWAWLNTTPEAYPRVQETWRTALIAQWQHEGRIGAPDARESQKQIHLLTSSIAEHQKLPLDVLRGRSMMLLDVRARVQLMKGALRDLLAAVSCAPSAVQ